MGEEAAAEQAEVHADSGEQLPQGPASMRSFALYTVARLALLGVAAALFALVGFRGLQLALVSLLVSGAVSLLALRRLRADSAGAIRASYNRVSDRIDARSSSEDVD